MPNTVTISHGGITATSRPLMNFEEACVDAEQRWVALWQSHPGALDQSNYPYIALEARNNHPHSYGAAWLKRHWDEAGNAGTVRSLNPSALDLDQARDLYNLSWRLSVKLRGPQGNPHARKKRAGKAKPKALGGRPSHWRAPKWETRNRNGHRHEPSATRTTSRSGPHGLIMIERCTCGAQREVHTYGMENIVGEWVE